MSIVSRTTVRQVLNDIKIRLPHSYDEDSLFLWINETMKKIYKDLAIQSKYSFTTRSGQEQYVLPEDCSIDMINSVTISDKSEIELLKAGKAMEWRFFPALKTLF